MSAIVPSKVEVVQQPEHTPATIHEVFLQMARDPTIDPARIGALMDLQIKAEDRQAEREFNAAFARLMPRLPRIVKRGKISLVKDGVSKGSIPFCTIDDMDEVIRPLYTAEGFTLSFLSKPCANGIIRVAVLRHVAGHHVTSEMQLPPDKGPGRNDNQALGSSNSYADRYLTRGIFNLILVGEDTDGVAPGRPINRQQVEALESLIFELSLTPESQSKFMATLGVKAWSDIQQGNHYNTALRLLEAKRRKG